VHDLDALPQTNEINRGEVCALTVTADGSPWAGVCSGAWIGYGFGPGGLARWDGVTWQPVDPDDALDEADWLTDISFVDADAEGGLWALASVTDRRELDPATRGDRLTRLPSASQSSQVLLRLEDGQWSAHPWETVAWSGAEFGNGHLHGLVDQPGRLWFGAGYEANAGRGNDILISFDGEQAARHPDVGTVRDQALHPDGSLWVVGPDGIFVIDPDVAHPEGMPRDASTEGGG
jgi:hypothetical protein